MADTGTGNSGTILRGQGAGATPKYSTATYPDTAGTSGNILTSDGTNFISSSSAGGGLLFASGTLTNAQIKALHGTPVQFLGAPGVGKVISIIVVNMKMNYGGTNVFVAGAGQTIQLYYTTVTSLVSSLTNANIVAAATRIQITTGIGGGAANGANSTYDNQAVNFYNPVATEITGNAANDNTITWSITYQIVSI